jgi:prevent-host-death family protein
MTATDVMEIAVKDFRARLADCLGIVARGGSVVVTSRGRPVARLVAPEPARGIPYGVLRGRIRMADDFDELPPEVLDAMEGGPP